MRNISIVLFATFISANASAQIICDSILQASFSVATQGSVVVLSSTSWTALPNATTYEWNTGDGAVIGGQTVTHIYQEPGDYLICLYAFIEGCTDSVCQFVNIGGDPPCSEAQVSFTWTSGGSEIVQFDVASSPQAIGYLWDFGDGTMGDGENPAHNYQEPGSYEVCVSAWTWNQQIQDTCWAEQCLLVVASGDEEPCDALQAGLIANVFPGGVQFSNTTTGTGFQTTWNWTFGDGTGSNDAQPFHVYPEPGNYLVCLTAISIYEQQGGGLITCVDSTCQEVTAPGGGSPCDGLDADFNVSVQGTMAMIDNAVSSNEYTYIWDFGDGTEGYGPDPMHTYSESGTYHICLLMWGWDPFTQDTCYMDHCEWITIGVGGACDSTFACFQWNLQNNLAQFFNCSSSNDPLNHWWSFGDGTTSNGFQPTHTYTSSGSYTVCLTVFNDGQGNCSDTICNTLIIQGSGSPCDSLSADFVVTTQNNLAAFNTFGGTAIGYHWNFGDGTEGDGPAPTHTYPGPGTYNACLVTWTWDPQTQDTCYVDHCEWITIGGGDPCAGLQADFQVSVGDVTVWFSNTTTGTGFQTTWSWTFGDGTTSNDAQPSHIFPGLGTYQVCLLATSIYEQQGGGLITCQDSVCQMVITGAGSPCDQLSAEWNAIGNGPTINFQNIGITTGNSYSWDFGDGTTGEGPNPFHIYEIPGEYYACLIVGTYDPITQDSCFEDHCEWITLVQGGTACDSLWTADFEFGHQGNVYTFFNTSNTQGAVVSTQWAFGDGTFGDGSQLIHTYTASGNYTVCMTITGIVPGTNDTCQVEVCQNIEVSVGVEDLTGALPINAWPQPFDGAVQLEGEGLRGNTRYTLLDMTGRILNDRTVLSQGQITLDYSGLPPGTYLLRLRNAHWDRSLRVMKR